MGPIIKKLLRDRKILLLVIALLTLGTIAFLSEYFHGDSSRPGPVEESFSADTVIPKGFVLVPIEIQNLNSIQNLIGSFAVVDLFARPQLGEKKSGHRVGHRLKLIRAPLNPQAFAVLVPEESAADILESQGPFMVVIQNPNQTEEGRIAKKTRAQPAPEVIYFNKEEGK